MKKPTLLQMEMNSFEPSKVDIFISYAREDHERVLPFADMLIEHGWTVWWDLRIRTGEQFHLIIEEALAKSACVIVFWTEHSTQSRWVLAEADEGANRDILVPILLDQVTIPIAFRSIHSADFINWSGDIEEEKVQTLIRDISAAAGQPEGGKGALVPDKDVVAVQPQLELETPDSVSTAPDSEPTQSPAFQWLPSIVSGLIYILVPGFSHKDSSKKKIILTLVVVLSLLTFSYFIIPPAINSFIDQRREIAERVHVEEEARLTVESAEQARIEEEQRRAELEEPESSPNDNLAPLVPKTDLGISQPKKENKKQFALYLDCVGGDAIACYNLGINYNFGRGIEQDMVKAVPLFRRACDEGFVYGCNNLGAMYHNGEGGLEQDEVKAVSLYRQACDGGNAGGCDNLGTLYHFGEGGLEQDKVKAVSLFRQACDGGASRGCANLGHMYFNGEGGVKQDKVKAFSLYRQACDGGVTERCEYLKSLER